jgi:hypothetical protein
MALERVQPNYSINSLDLGRFRYIFVHFNQLDPLEWLICRRTTVSVIARARDKNQCPAAGFCRVERFFSQVGPTCTARSITEALCIENSLKKLHGF